MPGFSAVQAAGTLVTFMAKSCLTRPSSVNVGKGANPPSVDFLLALARLGDIVRRLHPHERVHLYTECFFDAERHVPGKVCLAIEQAGEGRAET